MRLATLLVVVGVLTSAAPQFKDYPVAETFRGTPARPVLSSPLARAFRTELRRQAATGPNFAGHFTVARWGCGMGCTSVAVINARSGVVVFAPFAIEDVMKEGPDACHRGSDFEITSELFIAQGDVNGKVGRHYFRWRKGQFLRVYFEAGCPL